MEQWPHDERRPRDRDRGRDGARDRGLRAPGGPRRGGSMARAPGRVLAEENVEARIEVDPCFEVIAEALYPEMRHAEAIAFVHRFPLRSQEFHFYLIVTLMANFSVENPRGKCNP